MQISDLVNQRKAVNIKHKPRTFAPHPARCRTPGHCAASADGSGAAQRGGHLRAALGAAEVGAAKGGGAAGGWERCAGAVLRLRRPGLVQGRVLLLPDWSLGGECREDSFLPMSACSFHTGTGTPACFVPLYAFCSTRHGAGVKCGIYHCQPSTYMTRL